MKVCSCDSVVKIRLSSINKKLCGDCSGYSDWAVKDGETSTLNDGKKNAKVLGKKISTRNPDAQRAKGG